MKCKLAHRSDNTPRAATGSASPARARGRIRREVREVDATEDSEVVVSYQADVGALGDEGAAAVRARPVADEVAEAPKRVR